MSLCLCTQVYNPASSSPSPPIPVKKQSFICMHAHLSPPSPHLWRDRMHACKGAHLSPPHPYLWRDSHPSTHMHAEELIFSLPTHTCGGTVIHLHAHMPRSLPSCRSITDLLADLKTLTSVTKFLPVAKHSSLSGDWELISTPGCRLRPAQPQGETWNGDMAPPAIQTATQTEASRWR